MNSNLNFLPHLLGGICLASTTVVGSANHMSPIYDYSGLSIYSTHPNSSVGWLTILSDENHFPIWVPKFEYFLTDGMCRDFFIHLQYASLVCSFFRFGLSGM